MTSSARAGRIVGGDVLLPATALPSPGSLTWDGPTITSVVSTSLTAEGDGTATGTGGGVTPDGAVTIDATGAWVLPGIVDLHGDGFERCLMPRPGVTVDPAIALDETAAQLLAAGVTTGYVSATDSWAPGLRSRGTLRAMVDALGRWRGQPELRLHVRHERCQVADLDELKAWLADGTVTLFSFNDHTPADAERAAQVSAVEVQRSGLQPDEFAPLAVAAVAARPLGLAQERELAAVAAAAGCPLASHDVASEEHLQRDLALGVALAEFPLTVAVADRYLDHGLPILLGAPNVVRGGSHLGNLSVRDLLASGRPAVLCSDYHYPSLLHAPFVLAELGVVPFGAAWASVSAGPAAAVGLDDRGHLRPGARADVVVVEPAGLHGPARVRTVVSAGRIAFQRAPIEPAPAPR